MDKLKLFIRQKSAIRKLMSLTFLLTFLWMDFFVFGVIIGKPLTFAQAESTIRVGLRVLPSNPIENTEKIIPNNEKHESLSDLRSSSFRLISSVENTDKSLQLNETSQPGEKSDQVMESDGVVLGKSIVDFQGKAIYPNSNVLLEIRSSPFLTSVISDSQGNWTWTNWCHPLEDGEHWLEASNVSPFDLSGKRDIFIQRFKFFVKNQVDSKLTDQLALEKLISTAGTDGVADILGKGNVKDLYLFNIALLNKKEYNPQDEMF